MEKAKKTISTINAKLGEMPAIANNIIKFLNSKIDMTSMIWE